VKVPRRVGHSKSVEIATSEGDKTDDNEKITTNDDTKEEKWKTRSKVGQVGHFDISESTKRC
jgi:hypothetical protein